MALVIVFGIAAGTLVACMCFPTRAWWIPSVVFGAVASVLFGAAHWSRDEDWLEGGIYALVGALVFGFAVLAFVAGAVIRRRATRTPPPEPAIPPARVV